MKFNVISIEWQNYPYLTFNNDRDCSTFIDDFSNLDIDRQKVGTPALVSISELLLLNFDDRNQNKVTGIKIS